MNDSNFNDGTKTYLTPWRVVFAVILVASFLVVTTFVLYPIRNWKPETVAVRYLNNSPEIKAEAGEIVNIGPIDALSESQKIARRMQAGESPYEKESGDSSRFAKLPAGITNVRLKVKGAKREVEAEVSLERGLLDMNETSVYYTVTAMRFKDESGNWVAVPIGWSENYFLLFK